MGQSAALIAPVVAGAGKAYTQYQAGQMNASAMKFNAAEADLQATDALARGEASVRRHQQQTKLLMGAQTAALAAQGIDVSAAGTAQDVRNDTLQLGAQDESTIRANAIREAFGFSGQAGQFRLRGMQAASEGQTQALGTLATTGVHFAQRIPSSWFAPAPSNEQPWETEMRLQRENGWDSTPTRSR